MCRPSSGDSSQETGTHVGTTGVGPGGLSTLRGAWFCFFKDSRTPAILGKRHKKSCREAEGRDPGLLPPHEHCSDVDRSQGSPRSVAHRPGQWAAHPLYAELQFNSVQSLSRVRPCNPMNHSMPGLPLHHQLPEFTQTHVHQVADAIQPSHPLMSPSPPAPNPYQHQALFH